MSFGYGNEYGVKTGKGKGKPVDGEQREERKMWENSLQREEKQKREAGLAGTFVPHLRYDRAEPFPLVGIGYTLYEETRKSPSCRRIIEAPPGGVAIEYAFYYDFDIQHLYDLEHAFVYLDGEGKITGVESSFHGKFLNSMVEGVTEYEENHPVLFVQPGKHALLPAPEYFQLVIDRNDACNKNAGEAGFLISSMFEGRLFTNQELDRKVKEYIRRNYAFEPAWEFTDKSPDGRSTEELLMPYEELDLMIVERLSAWSEKILETTEQIAQAANE